MQINRATLEEAAHQGLISAEQSGQLWAFLQARAPDTPSFKPAHILNYLGGMIAIGAMSLFMTLGWERFGGGGLLMIATSYALACVVLTEVLRKRPQLALPAGIAAALAVVMVPLAVYGAQHLLGYWPDGDARGWAYRDYHARVDWRWLMMELATLAAGALALWRYRLPFLMLPVAVTLWYMSMDLVPFLLLGEASSFYSEEGKRISAAFGAAMLALAFWVDVRNRRPQDFAFWLYVFGAVAFWGGLTSMHSNSELGKFIYCCINLLMVAAGAALSRRVLAAFGGLGVALYLGHLSYDIFKDSLLFPVALTAIGLAVVGVGIWWQRHEAAIGARLRGLLPASVRSLVEHRAQS